MDTDHFFGILIDPLSTSGKTWLVLLAILLGGAIGLERQLHGNNPGLRTHILVCIGSTIITMASVEIGMGVRGGMRGEPGHIAAQIVSGIGFLGAGAILREGFTVKGITTAASVWTTAGIGITIGASPRLAELGVIATVACLLALVPLNWVEKKIHVKQLVETIEVEVRESERGPQAVLDLLVSLGLTVNGVQSQVGNEALYKHGVGATRHMQISVVLPNGFDKNKLNSALLDMPGVIAFHMTEPWGSHP